MYCYLQDPSLNIKILSRNPQHKETKEKATFAHRILPSHYGWIKWIMFGFMTESHPTPHIVISVASNTSCIHVYHGSLEVNVRDLEDP